MKGHPAAVIERLRARGLRVDVKHYRLSEAQRMNLMDSVRYEATPGWHRHTTLSTAHDLREQLRSVSGRGGWCVVTISHPEHGVVAAGESVCHLTENYSKKIGLAAALGRALKVGDTATENALEVYNDGTVFLRVWRDMGQMTYKLVRLDPVPAKAAA